MSLGCTFPLSQRLEPLSGRLSWPCHSRCHCMMLRAWGGRWGETSKRHPWGSMVRCRVISQAKGKVWILLVTWWKYPADRIDRQELVRHQHDAQNHVLFFIWLKMILILFHVITWRNDISFKFWRQTLRINDHQVVNHTILMCSMCFSNLFLFVRIGSWTSPLLNRSDLSLNVDRSWSFLWLGSMSFKLALWLHFSRRGLNQCCLARWHGYLGGGFK